MLAMYLISIVPILLNMSIEVITYLLRMISALAIVKLSKLYSEQ